MKKKPQVISLKPDNLAVVRRGEKKAPKKKK